MAPINVIADLDRTEALLWTILDQFESLAVAQYAARVKELYTPQKQAVVELLATRVQTTEELTRTRLAAPIAALVQSATSAQPAHVLVAQGLLLELIGESIYRIFAENNETSAATRELCQRGLAASSRARELVPGLLRTHIGSGEVLLQAIMLESASLLRSLDAVGEGIDEYFGERFQIGFADVMGDVAAELIATCLDLGVDRRKLVSFLTGALMGV